MFWNLLLCCEVPDGKAQEHGSYFICLRAPPTSIKWLVFVIISECPGTEALQQKASLLQLNTGDHCLIYFSVLSFFLQLLNKIGSLGWLEIRRMLQLDLALQPKWVIKTLCRVLLLKISTHWVGENAGRLYKVNQHNLTRLSKQGKSTPSAHMFFKSGVLLCIGWSWSDFSLLGPFGFLLCFPVFPRLFLADSQLVFFSCIVLIRQCTKTS